MRNKILILGSPAVDYQTTLFWAGNRSQGALLWPTDQLGWPSSVWALTLYLFWQKGRLVKADNCLCLMSGVSNLCVLSHYSMLQMYEMFLGIWHCCIAHDESYLGNGLIQVWHALAQSRRCLCSQITDALHVPALSIVVPQCLSEYLHTRHTARSSWLAVISPLT